VDGDRLFVTKVPQTLNREHLREHFAQFGELTDVYLPQVPGSAAHKGIAFISFLDPSTLHTVIQNAPHEICGLPVVVDLAAPRGTQVGKGKGGKKGGFAPGPGAFQPLAPMRRLPWEGHAPQQQAFWEPSFGGQELVPLGHHGFAGQHDFGAPALDMQPFVGKGVAGQPHAPNGHIVPGRLFLTKVAPDIQKADLELYFGQFGPLADVFIPLGKGIAFVSFNDPAHAMRVLQQQQHLVKPGSAVIVDQAVDRPPLGQDGNGKGKSKQPFKGGFAGGWNKGGFGPY
jgi:RNA recognition motif-containing protein